MFLINNLGNEPKQLTTFVKDELEVSLSLEYKDNQLGWYFGIQYGDNINFQNIRLTVSPNLLKSYSAYLPFGLMCLTDDGLEPMTIDDFSNGYAKLYILTKEECKLVENNYYAQISA